MSSLFIPLSRTRTRPSRSPLYSRLARYYDPIFERLLSKRIARTIQSLEIESGARVLDLGVGTGNYLASFPRDAYVIGIDTAKAMLELAARQVSQADLRRVELRQMNALQLSFPANTFNYVTAFHTISVVHDSRRMLEEMLRVCKPGGCIVIINHFRTQNSCLGKLLDSVSFLTDRLGWRADLRFSELFGDVPLTIQQCYKSSLLSLFTVVVGRKSDAHEVCTNRVADGILFDSRKEYRHALEKAETISGPT